MNNHSDDEDEGMFHDLQEEDMQKLMGPDSDDTTHLEKPTNIE